MKTIEFMHALPGGFARTPQGKQKRSIIENLNLH